MGWDAACTASHTARGTARPLGRRDFLLLCLADERIERSIEPEGQVIGANPMAEEILDIVQLLLRRLVDRELNSEPPEPERHHLGPRLWSRDYRSGE